MATLVLGTIGRVIGGPLGGLAGTFLGSALDRSVFGSAKTREGPRTTNLAVQSSAYGEALPRLYGRMRVAGNLVWTAGIRETRSSSGGGKRGPATANYSYSASFAVIVSSRTIVSVGRIWADGKLLRAADGSFIYPAVVRTYFGDDDQPVDPLIAAAEGIANAPAYRGRAYVVFDALPLADYGNRIPNLTFEVVADEGETVGVDVIARDICAAAGAPRECDGVFPVVEGFAAAHSGTARQALAPLVELADLSFVEGEAVDVVRSSEARPPFELLESDMGATAEQVAGPLQSTTRAAAGTVPDAIIVGFSDTARDFQLGLQRAVRQSPPMRSEQRDFDIALSAPAAKQLAEALLRRAIAGRSTGTITLPWRYAALRAGDVVRSSGDTRDWRVRTWSLVGPVVDLAVERLTAGSSAGARDADPGRIYDPGDSAPGPTVLHVLDLPPLTAALPASPQLLVAAAGASKSWSRAEVVLSADAGGSYASVAVINAAATIGSATTVLPDGNCDRWDRRSTIDVVVLNDEMWLESRSEALVLAGANLALIGDEILQFATVAALAPRRFRLSNLLRGRRATEAAAAGHAAGERFVMLDPDRLTTLDIATDLIGATLLFKALGAADDIAATVPVVVRPTGRSLRPLAPIAIHVERQSNSDFGVVWTRRSRGGFAWLDGIDAPLAEEVERYRLTISLDGGTVREVTVSEPRWSYPAATLLADGGASAAQIGIAVAQISGAVGVGASASATFTMAAL